MDFPSVIEKLKGSQALLTAPQLATIFDVHFSTIRRWLRQLSFPKPVTLERQRLWRPDLVLTWTASQELLAQNMLSREQVCERMDIYYKTLIRRVKQGRAPAPRHREIGSGRHMWNKTDVDEWMAKEYGGYSRPHTPHKPPRKVKPHASTRRGPKHHDKLNAAAL